MGNKFKLINEKILFLKRFNMIKKDYESPQILSIGGLEKNKGVEHVLL